MKVYNLSLQSIVFKKVPHQWEAPPMRGGCRGGARGCRGGALREGPPALNRRCPHGEVSLQGFYRVWIIINIVTFVLVHGSPSPMRGAGAPPIGGGGAGEGPYGGGTLWRRYLMKRGPRHPRVASMGAPPVGPHPMDAPSHWPLPLWENFTSFYSKTKVFMSVIPWW